MPPALRVFALVVSAVGAALVVLTLLSSPFGLGHPEVVVACGLAEMVVSIWPLSVSGAWRSVTTTRVRTSGRFTLTAKPPARGNQRYRAVLGQVPSAPERLSSYSSVMVLAVT